VEVRGGDYYQLIDRVRRHRHLNNLDTRGIEKEVQAYLCEVLGPEARSIYCRGEPIKHVEDKTHVPYDDLKHFLLTVGNTRRFVSAAEAQVRAEICAGCPRNVPISGCSACRNLVGLVFNVIGNRKTPLDSKLKACGVCRCELKAAVHIPLEAFPVVAGHDYPTWCWRNTTVSSVPSRHPV